MKVLRLNATWLQPDRVARRHRHHRDSRWPDTSRRASSARSSEARSMREQPEATGSCGPRIREYARGVSPKSLYVGVSVHDRLGTLPHLLDSCRRPALHGAGVALQCLEFTRQMLSADRLRPRWKCHRRHDICFNVSVSLRPPDQKRSLGGQQLPWKRRC